MAKGLTEARIANLKHVRDHGKPTPRSPAGYHCRILGLTEFMWLYEDGAISTTSEKAPRVGCNLVKVVGERLTPAGRRALSDGEGG